MKYFIRPPPAKLLGLVLAFGGVAAVFHVSSPLAGTASHLLAGDLMALSAAMFWAATTLYIKHITEKVSLDHFQTFFAQLIDEALSPGEVPVHHLTKMIHCGLRPQFGFFKTGALGRGEDLAADLAVLIIHRVHVDVDPALPHGLIERCDVVHGVHLFRADEFFKDGEGAVHNRIGVCFQHIEDAITDSITGACLPEVDMDVGDPRNIVTNFHGDGHRTHSRVEGDLRIALHP